MYASEFLGQPAAFLTAGQEMPDHSHIRGTVAGSVQKPVEGLVV
jgi:hypothetical protein